MITLSDRTFRCYSADKPESLGAGRPAAIRCCFHEEQTPSLVLYPDGKFSCLSCGASGTWHDGAGGVIDLVEES